MGKHNILKTNQHVFNESLYVATTKQCVIQEGANKIQWVNGVPLNKDYMSFASK
jgi:hypothetical protein